MDAGQDQDAHGPEVPHGHDVVGDLADAAEARLEPSGSGSSCRRAGRGGGGRLGEGGVAAPGTVAAALGAWLVFEGEAGFSITPPTSCTWGRRGSTPVILVRGRSQCRFSIAALCCYQAGERSRLVYRPKRHTDLKNGDHKRCGHKSGGRAGFSMTPPTSRTWGKRGTTPVIRVRGRSQRRFSIAALCCYKLGERSHLIYRPRRHTDHKSGGRKSFAWTEYRDLLIAAHQQLGGPIVLIWDNLNVHKDVSSSTPTTGSWPTTYRPTHLISTRLRASGRCSAGPARPTPPSSDPDHLLRRLRLGLRRIQYRSDIIDGCLTATGLTLTTPRLQPQ